MDNEEWLAMLRDDIVFEETLLGQALTFHATWGLFSPREVDDGTRLLLRHVDVGEGDECLDLGCGYGPIGIALAKA
ncbi:MAG: methyltransferase, partial [Gammaproteobacteria bacterium]|nr:methyltransferase [Gammaproteobacteria bacterium]